MSCAVPQGCCVPSPSEPGTHFRSLAQCAWSSCSYRPRRCQSPAHHLSFTYDRVWADILPLRVSTGRSCAAWQYAPWWPVSYKNKEPERGRKLGPSRVCEVARGAVTRTLTCSLCTSGPLPPPREAAVLNSERDRMQTSIDLNSASNGSFESRTFSLSSYSFGLASWSVILVCSKPARKTYRRLPFWVRHIHTSLRISAHRAQASPSQPHLKRGH